MLVKVFPSGRSAGSTLPAPLIGMNRSFAGACFPARTDRIAAVRAPLPLVISDTRGTRVEARFGKAPSVILTMAEIPFSPSSAKGEKGPAKAIWQMKKPR
jgi:hypothetical protein